jgi:hypothetical protein
MIEFSVDSYKITVYIDEKPTILDFYKKHATFIDDKDLKNEGTVVYVIISKNPIQPEYVIIAFRSEPIGYGGFKPGIHFENKILGNYTHLGQSFAHPVG